MIHAARQQHKGQQTQRAHQRLVFPVESMDHEQVQQRRNGKIESGRADQPLHHHFYRLKQCPFRPNRQNHKQHKQQQAKNRHQSAGWQHAFILRGHLRIFLHRLRRLRLFLRRRLRSKQHKQQQAKNRHQSAGWQHAFILRGHLRIFLHRLRRLRLFLRRRLRSLRCFLFRGRDSFLGLAGRFLCSHKLPPYTVFSQIHFLSLKLRCFLFRGRDSFLGLAGRFLCSHKLPPYTVFSQIHFLSLKLDGVTYRTHFTRKQDHAIRFSTKVNRASPKLYKPNRP